MDSVEELAVSCDVSIVLLEILPDSIEDMLDSNVLEDVRTSVTVELTNTEVIELNRVDVEAVMISEVDMDIAGKLLLIEL